ncbi:hypothetical protein [Campylobacter corcagiensis]|nr:hypothetical protein [Campylobacter corcagiensis]
MADIVQTDIEKIPEKKIRRKDSNGKLNIKTIPAVYQLHMFLADGTYYTISYDEKADAVSAKTEIEHYLKRNE